MSSYQVHVKGPGIFSTVSVLFNLTSILVVINHNSLLLPASRPFNWIFCAWLHDTRF